MQIAENTTHPPAVTALPLSQGRGLAPRGPAVYHKHRDCRTQGRPPFDPTVQRHRKVMKSLRRGLAARRGAVTVSSSAAEVCAARGPLRSQRHAERRLLAKTQTVSYELYSHADGAEPCVGLAAAPRVRPSAERAVARLSRSGDSAMLASHEKPSNALQLRLCVGPTQNKDAAAVSNGSSCL
jgi:hypothetical protein